MIYSVIGEGDSFNFQDPREEWKGVNNNDVNTLETLFSLAIRSNSSVQA